MESKNQFSDFEKGIVKASVGLTIALAVTSLTGNPLAGLFAGKGFLLSQQR